MKQNTQDRNYLTLKITKHNNKKYIIYKIKQKHTKHTTIYIVYIQIKWKQKDMKERDKGMIYTECPNKMYAQFDKKNITV
jgi:hypothetical protein